MSPYVVIALVALLTLVLAPAAFGYRIDDAARAVTLWQPTAIEAQALTGVDYRIILAIVAQETGGVKPTAPGLYGEVGLMQVRPAALSDVNVRARTNYQPYMLDDPLTGLYAGAMYFQIQRDRFSSDYLAFAAYNAGADNYASGYKYADSVTKIKQTLRLLT